ncbi:TPA: hypothetical protein DCQ22_04150 [Candidatus Nomurabacteria bacterium]|nr:hypothetical protein [Candidatus Nomurabacteria bacterium]
MICFHCNEEIEDSQERTMLGLDVPYVNLFFHKNCFNLYVKSDINLYLAQKSEIEYNRYIECKIKKVRKSK